MTARNFKVKEKILIMREHYGEKEFYEIEVLYKAKNTIKILLVDEGKKLWYAYEDFDEIYKFVEELKD